MNTRTRMQLLAILTAGTALLGAGCGQREPTETTGQKIDRAAASVASAMDKTTVKAAAVVDDVAITAKVKTAVMAEPGLKTLQISIDTKDAVVTLAGTVDSPTLKERATQLAQQVEGVRSVVDQLVVKPS